MLQRLHIWILALASDPGKHRLYHLIHLHTHTSSSSMSPLACLFSSFMRTILAILIWFSTFLCWCFTSKILETWWDKHSDPSLFAGRQQTERLTTWKLPWDQGQTGIREKEAFIRPIQYPSQTPWSNWASSRKPQVHSQVQPVAYQVAQYCGIYGYDCIWCIVQKEDAPRRGKESMGTETVACED